MNTPLLRLKEFFKCILLILVMSLFSSHLKAQITISSLATGDFINGTQGNYILNGTTGTGPTYFKNSNLFLSVAIDGSNNIAFSQQSTTSISRIDGSRIITFPAATNIGALAVDRDNEFIYAASPSSSTSLIGSINRYIWKNTNKPNSVGYYVGGAVSNAAQTTVATVPFINSTDLVFLNGASSTSPLSIGLNNLCLAFDLTGNLYYADYTNNMVRKISIEKATPGATASAASTITLSGAPSAAVKVNDLVSGLFIPASTYITAISGSSITLSKPITGAIDGTSTLAIITGVSDIVGTGTAGITLGATAGTTQIRTPYGLTFDPSGNLFLYDEYFLPSPAPIDNGRVLKISAPISSTSAVAIFGSGYSNKVQGIATDVNGNLYLADKGAGKILKISANGGAASVLVGTAGSLNLSAYTTTAGNPVIATGDLTNLNKLKPGMKIRGTGIPNGATVVAINNTTVPYSITISTPAGVFAAAPYGNAATGSTSLAVSSANSIVAGQNVVGAGIPPNTTVVSLSGTTVTLSAQTTAALVTTQLFFYAPTVFGTQVASTTTNSSSEDGFITSVGSYGYVENPFGIAVSNDATNPFVVYPEQFQKYVRKISGSSINTSTAAVPTITSFTPTASVLAGATITITGTNFTGATAVSFGGNDAASFTVLNPTSITAVIGTGTTGNIYVTTPGGTAVSGSTLKVIPVVSAFTPTSGASGGIITITGNNFLAATAVKIGGIAVASFTVNDNTTITATAAATATGTIAVTTAAGTGTSTGTFTFVTAPSALTYSTATSTTTYGTAGTSVAPTVNGGVPTYSLTGTVPEGVSIDPSTGIISYSNVLAAGNYSLTVTASNNFPGSTTATYTITVNAIAPSSLSYSLATTTANYGTAGTSAVPSINNGGAAVTYSIGAPVPAGISIDATTGMISYANTLAVGNYPLTVIGTSTAGSTNTTYTISINAIAPITLVYSPATKIADFGAVGTSVAPTINSGGATIVYSLTGTIPAGITINTATGLISYTATLAVGTYPLAVVATNSIGNTGSNYNLTISAIAPTALVYSPATKADSFGTAGTSVAPAINTGGATVTYSLTGTVPSGITINSTTGVISYANTLSAGNYPLTINAANSIASTTATYSVTINAVAPSALVYSPATLTGARASAGTSVSPSINNGGAVVTYSILTGAVAGITINSSTGLISYTSTLAAGSYPLTVKALNSAGNITTAFNITITASSDANLNSLAISKGTLMPVFNSGTTSYTVEVPLAISSVTFTPTTSDSFASIKINGTTVTSGAVSAGISLATGPNAVNVVVTAQNGITKTYTVTVTRLALIPQTISFAALSAVTYGATGQSVGASSTNSTIPLTYTSSNIAVATISTTGVIQTVGVGSTSITVAQSGNSTYQVATPVSQTLNVNPAALTITARNIGKEYDGVPYSGGNGVTYTGFVLGDDASKLSGSLSYVGTAQGAKNVGSYLISPIGNTATNYVISYQTGSLAITKAALTVTADNKAMCQGNALPVLTLSYNGFKNGDTENSLNTKPAVSTTARSASSAGNYVLSPTGGTSANYTFAYVNGTLTINALTTVGITSSKTSISKGEILVLTASGGNTYQWSNGNGISGSLNSAVLTIRPTQSGSYTVTATNAGGCSQTSSINIEVRDDFEAVKANNILSPNGDGYNDLWEVKNIDMYPNNEVKVFDKSGRLLYNKRGYDNSWNATLNGNALQEGTYYYIIDFGTGKLKQTGYITIIGQQ